MTLRLRLEDGKSPEEEGYGTQQALLEIFEYALRLQSRKAQAYGEAWSEQGYMGNVARVLSKVSRLRNMVWRDFGIEDADEPILDTLFDLINLAAFTVINKRRNNKWGRTIRV